MEREHCAREGVECEVTSDALALDNSKRLVALAGSRHACLIPSNITDTSNTAANTAESSLTSETGGLLMLLDELSESVEEYSEEHAHLFKDYSNFELPTFSIVHYFGTVHYDASTFPTTLQANVRSTHLDKINSALSLQGHRSQQALDQVTKLVQDIEKCSLHFVKCLRASPVPGIGGSTPKNANPKVGGSSMQSGFDRRHMCESLRSSGILEAADLMRQSRPIRWSHQEFAKKFLHLLECRARPQATSEVMSGEVAAAWRLKEETPLVSYVATFHSASMGFGLKFVRTGLPVVARRTPKAPACVLTGHVLRTVAGVDLYDVKKTTLANAEADGKVGLFQLTCHTYA